MEDIEVWCWGTDHGDGEIFHNGDETEEVWEPIQLDFLALP